MNQPKLLCLKIFLILLIFWTSLENL